MNIPEGVLKKETKTREQVEKDLEDDIKKKQEALDRMIKSKPVLSSRAVREAEQRESLRRTSKVSTRIQGLNFFNF